MTNEPETPEIEHAIALLTACTSRERPLSVTAEDRILARLERAFEDADHADLELVDADRSGTISRRPVMIAAIAAVLVLISLSAAAILNNGLESGPAGVPAASSDEGTEDADRRALSNPLTTIRSELTGEAVELF